MRLALQRVILLCLALSTSFAGCVCAARTQQAPVAETVAESANSLRLQLQSILNAATNKGDSKLFDDLVDNLRVPEMPNWFDEMFGTEIGSRLGAAYTNSWNDYRNNIKTMFREDAARKDTKVFVKEFSQAPSAPAGAFIRSILLSAVRPLVLYTATTGTKNRTDSLPGIYLFEQGAFRVVNWQTLYELPNVKPVRIRLPEEVSASQVEYQVKPVLPSNVQQPAREKIVLHIVIDQDGVVTKAEPVSGSPELSNAAIDAVRQWRYKPVSLNGDPVEVDTIVTIAF